MNNFSLSSKSSQNVAIMTPKGYINDMGAERLERTSEEFLDNGMKNLVVNFMEVQYINTIGVSIFTGIVQKARDYNGRLCFTNMKKVHRDIFEIVGLIKHVTVFKDEDDALKFLKRKE